MTSTITTWAAIVLAGERSRQHPLLQHTGVPCKALIALNGQPMLLRVIQSLQASPAIDQLLLVGPEKTILQAAQQPDQQAIHELMNHDAIQWLAPQSTPSTSAYQALQYLSENRRVLLTTADHVFLNTTIIDHFCQKSLIQNDKAGADVTIGLAPYPLVQQAFPTLKKTVLRFKDGNFCGCNLFAFMTPKGRQVAHYWRQMEQQRKNPFQFMRLLGWRSVLRYALGQLTLNDALQKLSKRWQLRLSVVILPFAEAAIDMDSVADYEAIKIILRDKE